MRNLIFYLAFIDSDINRKKFEQLYQDYDGVMFLKAKSLVEDEDAADDIVSESWLKLARNLDKIGMVASPNVQAYVMQTVERTAIDYFRERKRGQTVSIEMVEELAAPDIESFTGSNLARAILQLPLPYQHAILLKYAQGYNTREIASILECTVSRVEKLLSRGKKQLRQLLDKEEQSC